MEYYSAIKRTKVVRFAETRMGQEIVIQSQKEKSECHVVSTICGI